MIKSPVRSGRKMRKRSAAPTYKEKTMALTGIQIFKLLPKTNCKECGVPTCLAFAMNLASGKAELDSCPYVSAEAREQLAEASAPPIRPVVLGKGVRFHRRRRDRSLSSREDLFQPHGVGGPCPSDTPTPWSPSQAERLECPAVRARGPQPAAASSWL
jgi:hypothetical protein